MLKIPTTMPIIPENRCPNLDDLALAFHLLQPYLKYDLCSMKRRAEQRAIAKSNKPAFGEVPVQRLWVRGFGEQGGKVSPLPCSSSPGRMAIGPRGDSCGLQRNRYAAIAGTRFTPSVPLQNHSFNGLLDLSQNPYRSS